VAGLKPEITERPDEDNDKGNDEGRP
jgi:hypothetical protein